MDVARIIEIAGAAVTIVGFFYYLRFNVDQAKEENKEQWRVITKLRDWQEQHQNQSSEYRLQTEKEFGKVRENAGKIESQLSELVNLIKALDARFERWIEKQH